MTVMAGRGIGAVLAMLAGAGCAGENAAAGDAGNEPTRCDVDRTFVEQAVLFLDFEEVRDGTVSDASGGGRAGTIVGDVSFADGWCGKAAEFDGTESWVEVAPDPVLEGEGGITIEFAFALTDPSRDLISPLKKEARDGPEFSYSVRLMPEVEGFDVMIAGCRGVSEGAGDFASGWHHFAATWDGGTEIRAFLDGKRLEQRSEVCGTAPDPALDEPLRIGGIFNIVDVWVPIVGRLDDVAIFDHPRTDEVICEDSLGRWDGTTCVRPPGEEAL